MKRKYSVSCDSCGASFAVRVPREKFGDLKANGTPCSCGATAKYVFNVSGVQLQMVGNAWADKNHREKKYRKARGEEMSRRQTENVWKPTLAPNYKGERVDSWKEAQARASSEGRNASAYDKLVKDEAK